MPPVRTGQERKRVHNVDTANTDAAVREGRYNLASTY